MEEKIIKEVLDAQKKYSKSKEDFYEKAEKFLKKFLEEHGGKFNVNDKLDEMPYFYHRDDDARVSECIIKDIYLEDDCIYADLLGRFHEDSPFDDVSYEGVDFYDLLYPGGEIELFIRELTDWQDD